MTTTTSAASNPVQHLFRRLRSLDKRLTKARVQSTIFPEWWSDEACTSNGAIQQLKAIVARHLNIELASILDDDSALRFKDTHCKFKHAANKTTTDLQVATSIAASLSAIVTDAAVTEVKPIPTAANIRRSILTQGNPWVELSSLIAFCWSHGVPVLYIPEIPASKKMDGLAINIEGRPVIVLAKKAKHATYMLFDLAHELGHIACGHVQSGCTLVDEEIKSDNESDFQEIEANRFALELLTGNADTAYHSNGIRITALQLANAAEAKGRESNTDPQHIIANWGKVTGLWQIANAALNVLDPNPTWPKLFQEALLNGIDEDSCREDDLSYLYSLTGIES